MCIIFELLLTYETVYLFPKHFKVQLFHILVENIELQKEKKNLYIKPIVS